MTDRPQIRSSATPSRRMVPTLATGILAVGLMIAFAATVHGDASHEGWPTNKCNYNKRSPGSGCGTFKRRSSDRSGHMRGTDLTDELLGGHGSDTIYAGDAGDVIWGDYKPCCQPSTQHDRMYGEGGGDYIYTSHGKNDIDAGPGNDVIQVRFGRGGKIDCGEGDRDKLLISKTAKPKFKITNCESVKRK